MELWRSFESFDARCSLRTWIYRVAHNVASTHVAADRRAKARQLVSLDEMDLADDRVDPASAIDRRLALEHLMALIRDLRPIDRQVMLLCHKPCIVPIHQSIPKVMVNIDVFHSIPFVS